MLPTAEDTVGGDIDAVGTVDFTVFVRDDDAAASVVAAVGWGVGTAE